MMTFTWTGETSGNASIGRLGRTTAPAPMSSRTLRRTNRRCDSANSTRRSSITCRPEPQQNAPQRGYAADRHLVLVGDRARDHHVVLVLGEQRHRHQPKAALDRDKDGRGLAAPDERAVGDLPGALTGGKKTDPYRGGLPRTQLARVRHFGAHQHGLGRRIGRLRDQHDPAGRRRSRRLPPARLAGWRGCSDAGIAISAHSVDRRASLTSGADCSTRWPGEITMSTTVAGFGRVRPTASP